MKFCYAQIEMLDIETLVKAYHASFGQSMSFKLRDKLNADYIYIEIAARCLPLMPETSSVDHNFSMIDMALKKCDLASDTFEYFLMKSIQKYQ